MNNFVSKAFKQATKQPLISGTASLCSVFAISAFFGLHYDHPSVAIAGVASIVAAPIVTGIAAVNLWRDNSSAAKFSYACALLAGGGSLLAAVVASTASGGGALVGFVLFPIIGTAVAAPLNVIAHYSRGKQHDTPPAPPAP
jgi:Kef-type K+ transport system membrane component KefB